MSEIDRTETPREPAGAAPYDASTRASDPPPGHALAGGPLPAASTDATAGGDTIGVERKQAPPPDETRREIERTRARMSTTIDEIEEALVRKRTEIRGRFDPAERIRRSPVPATAAAFGVGLVLGFLTGGDDEADDREGEIRAALAVPADGVDDELERLEERSGSWEQRTRRLLRVARSQEEEIDRLRSRLDALEAGGATVAGAHARRAYRDDAASAGGVVDDLRTAAGEMRDSVLGGIAGILTDAFHQLREGTHDTGRA